MQDAGVGLGRVSHGGLVTLPATLAARLGLPIRCRLRAIANACMRESRGELIAMARALMAARGARHVAELCFHAVGDQPLWLRVVARRDRSRVAGNVTFTLIDSSDDRAMMDQLRESEEHWRYIVQFNPQLPWVADANGQVTDVTERWIEATGMPREAAMTEGWMALTHPDDVARVHSDIIQSMAEGRPFDVRARLLMNGGYRWMRAQGYPRHDDQGQIIRWYGYTEDVHDSAEIEQQTRWNAEHDSLTGLINRAHFNLRLEQALAASLHDLERVGVLMIDLDHFKEVNDLMGHQTGDDLLIGYSAQLVCALPADAVIARFGGDEFAVMLPGLHDMGELLAHADRLLAIRQTATGGGCHIECRASIGAAIFPEHGRHPSELLGHADLALYAAKGSSETKRMLFEPQMQHEVRERAAMVQRARRAAEAGGVLAYYQPKVDLLSGRLVGFEALLRWRDMSGRIQPPGSIIAAFEDPEVADLLGQTMLRHVLSDLKQWQAAGLDFGTVAINAAPAELRRSGFAARLVAALREADLPPRSVEVEVTEGVFLGRGANEAKRAIHALHEAGIAIALDDFGTGFASLTHLRALPVDAIKIDRSFIANIADADGDKAIVSAIVTLGHNMGMEVIAEGIETPEQADTLRRFGCKLAQGYYFGIPTPAAGIPHLIRAWGRSEDETMLAPLRRSC